MYSRKAATKWNVKETDLKVLIVFFKKKKQPRQLNALYCSRVLCSIRWLSILFDTSFSFHDDSRSPTVSRCACHRLPSRSRTRQCPAPAKETSRLLPPPLHPLRTRSTGLAQLPSVSPIFPFYRTKALCLGGGMACVQPECIW